jgi:hypothetical protein
LCVFLPCTVTVNVLTTGLPPVAGVNVIVSRTCSVLPPLNARERLHARAAEMLMGAGVSAAQIAVHVLRSSRGLEGALDMLLTAGRTALAQGAPQVAPSYFRRALEERLDAQRRAGLLIELGSAEAQAGDAGAVEHLSAGLRSAHDPERRVEAALALAHLLAAGERMAESVAILTELGDDLTESPAGRQPGLF